MRIGIFDSGLGGLTVLRAIQSRLPSADLVYLGDTARTPYGSKGAATIVRYARECASFLFKQRIDVLVVACNTASAWALPVLQTESPVPVVGTVEPAVRSCLSSHDGGAIGVIGTAATIASDIFPRVLNEKGTNLDVITRACPLFVPLVEEGILEGELAEKVVEHYLSPLRGKVSSVILACTHYPLIRSTIQDFLGPGVKIHDCAEAIAQDLCSAFPPTGSVAASRPAFYVTDGVSRFNRLASLLLEDNGIQAVRLEEL